MAEERISLRDNGTTVVNVSQTGTPGPPGYADVGVVSKTLTNGVINELGSVNRWAIPSATTLQLPQVSEGSTYLVNIDKPQNVTWPSGTVVIGTLTPNVEAWVTLVKEPVGWTVLAPATPAGGGLPVYSATHPLFSPGSGQGSSLAAFNDFFGTNLTSLSQTAQSNQRLSYLFKYGTTGTGGGAVGRVWFDPIKQKFKWAQTLFDSAARDFLPVDGSTGQVKLPSGMATGAALTPAVSVAFLGFIPPSEQRDATVGAESYPTAVNTVADLSNATLKPSGTNLEIPIGACIFVVALGKPVWKKNTTGNGTWVDATGAQVFPVP